MIEAIVQYSGSIFEVLIYLIVIVWAWLIYEMWMSPLYPDDYDIDDTDIDDKYKQKDK
jgi:hypothetical protein